MPVILRNNATSIEVDISSALKYTINKGDFDVILESTGLDAGMVIIVLRSHAITERYIKLDWRDISSPTQTSAQGLRDLLLSWNTQQIIIQSSALPAGAATSDNQINGNQATRIVDSAGIPRGILMEDNSLTSRDYQVAIAEGDILNHKLWSQLGFNGDIDNTEEDVIEQGGTYSFPALTGIQMDIRSSSANDDGVGLLTGIRTVTLYYLDETGTSHSEDITLHGTAVVATVALKISRVNGLRAKTIGSGGSAAGNITLTEHGATTHVYAQISTGFTRSRQAIYTVPKNFNLAIGSVVVSGVNGSVSHWCRFILRATYDDEISAVTTFFLPFAEMLVMDATVDRELSMPLKFPAGTDIKVSAISDAGASNEIVACVLRGWLEAI